MLAICLTAASPWPRKATHGCFHLFAWYCEATGRRHRISPCRSAYYASPWRLLNLSLRRRRRESALLFPESWWHLTMWGSRPSHFMIIPNTKRHPNNTKTDQLPISEVITGLPRPYRNNRPANEKRLYIWTSLATVMWQHVNNLPCRLNAYRII